jgi:MFS family permease
MILALGTGVAVPALPTLAKSFNVSFGLASGVVTMYLLGNLAGTIPSGWLVDRFGRRPVLIAGPLLSASMAFLVAGAQSFPELLVLRFFNGVAAQMWIVARLAAISMNAAPGQRGRLVSWMFGMDSTGRLAGPVLGGFIAYTWGTRSPFIVYAVLALVALVPTLLFSKDTPRAQRSEKKTDEAGPSKLSLREIVVPRWQYFGVAFFAGLTRGPLQADLLYVYAAFAYALGPRPIGYLATSASLISLPIGFIAGWVLDRFGRKRTMVPGFGGVSIAMTALALSAYLHLPLAWYVVLFLFGVMLQSFTGGSVQTVGADVAPPEARGTFLGIWRFASQGGAALSPIIFAVLSDTVNYGTAFMFTAVSASIVTFLLVRYVPETRVKTAAA